MTQRKLLVMSLTLGLLTAFLIFTYVRAAVRGDAETVPTVVQVVVAQKEMRPKSTLTASMLAVREVPRAQANPDALHTVDEAVGRLVKENMLAGEQVLSSRLYARDEKPGLTFAIPPGKRAVSVAVNEVIGVAGFIKPGDHVDVLSTFDEQVVGKTVTVTVLQDVEVLAISQLMEDKDPNAQVATTATLALSLDEAEKITLAEERGKLRLVLRPAGHSGQEYVGQATTKLMTQDRKGQGLDKLVPGARPVNRSATSVTVSTSPKTPVPATPTPAATKVTEPAKQAPSWPVELYRGVNLEVVTVDEDGRDVSSR